MAMSNNQRVCKATKLWAESQATFSQSAQEKGRFGGNGGVINGIGGIYTSHRVIAEPPKKNVSQALIPQIGFAWKVSGKYTISSLTVIIVWK